jgi:hypothetical protein
MSEPVSALAPGVDIFDQRQEVIGLPMERSIAVGWVMSEPPK